MVKGIFFFFHLEFPDTKHKGKLKYNPNGHRSQPGKMSNRLNPFTRKDEGTELTTNLYLNSDSLELLIQEAALKLIKFYTFSRN